MVGTSQSIVKEDFAFDTAAHGRSGIRYYDYQIARLGDGFTSTWRDVTERKEAEAEREHLLAQLRGVNERLITTSIEAQELRERAERRSVEWEALFESIAEPICVVEEPGYLMAANRAMLAWLSVRSLDPGEEAMDALHRFDLRHLDGRLVPSGQHPSDLVLGGEEFRDLPYQLINRQGQRMDVLVSGGPINVAEGAPKRGLVIIHDVTALRTLERRREEFTSLITHDLCNVLTSLIGHSDWLHRLLLKRQLATEAKSAEAIWTSGKQLTLMLQELAESTRLESGQTELVPEQVDLWQLVSGLVERLGLPDDRKRI